MMQTIAGGFDGRRLRIGVIASRFNETIAGRLAEGALDALRRHGVPEEGLTMSWVPGAFELPVAAARMAASGEFDAIVCVGAVVRGETAHFDLIAAHAANGIGRASMDSGVPITFGVLTTENSEQAEARAGGKLGNKGAEAAVAAIEMANLFAAFPKPRSDI